MTKKQQPKAETLWMWWFEDVGFAPQACGYTKEECERRHIDLGGAPYDGRPVRVTIAPAKPKKRRAKR